MATEPSSVFCSVRETAGLSVAEAAELFALSVNQVLDIEAGKTKPQARHIQILKGLIAIQRRREERPRFTYYDFFAGGGMAGMGLGSRWRCTFANDIDEVKASAYRAYNGEEALVITPASDKS